MVPIAKIAIELIEGDALIALGHVVESFLDGGDVFRLRLRMNPSPFIQSFFGG